MKLEIRLSYGKMLKIFLFSIIWYVEFCVRYFQYPNTLLLLGAALAGFLILDYLSGGKRTLGKMPAAVGWLFAYEIYTIVFGAVVSPNISAHINQSIIMVEYMLPFIAIVYYAKTRNDSDFIIWNFAILYTLMCLIFLYRPIYYRNNAHFGRYSFAAGMNPNNFGMCMATGAWSVLYLASKKKFPLVGALLISGLQIYAIFLSGSRKGIIGILMIIALWIVLCYIPNTDAKKWYAKIAKIGFCVIIVCVGIVVLAPYYLESNLARRMGDLIGEASGGARNEMYIKGLEYFKNAPIFGYGLQGFRYFYGGYSHATIVEVPVTGGVIGIALYLCFYASILKGVCKKTSSNCSIQSKEAFVQKRMGLVLFASLMFYSIAMIHIYELSSYVYFATIVAAYSTTSKKHKENDYGFS